MDFSEVISSVDSAVLDELQAASDGRESYERHVMDGIHEAIDYQMREILYDVVGENLPGMYGTLHHLLEEDLHAGDPAESLLGTMLAEANMHAAVKMSRLIQDNEDLFRAIIEDVVEETIERFENADFDDWYTTEDEDDDNDDEWLDVDILEDDDD